MFIIILNYLLKIITFVFSCSYFSIPFYLGVANCDAASKNRYILYDFSDILALAFFHLKSKVYI